MSSSIITITETTNIKNGVVVDNSKVEQRTYDSDMDVLKFYNSMQGKMRKDTLINVSVYDDQIVEDDKKFVILHMLTK